MTILFLSLSFLMIFRSLLAIVVSPWISYKFLSVDICILLVCAFKLILMSVATSSQAYPICLAFSRSALFYLICLSNLLSNFSSSYPLLTCNPYNFCVWSRIKFLCVSLVLYFPQVSLNLVELRSVADQLYLR